MYRVNVRIMWDVQINQESHPGSTVQANEVEVDEIVNIIIIMIICYLCSRGSVHQIISNPMQLVSLVCSLDHKIKISQGWVTLFQD